MLMKTTLKQRSELYKSKPVKNSAKGIYVPKEKGNKEAREERRRMIMEMIKDADKFFCPALNSYVYVRRKGKKETVHHASKSRKSTIAALNLKNLYSEAKYICQVSPKDNSNQKNFKRLHILLVAVEHIGYAKITVGEFGVGLDEDKYNHYCVVHVSLKEIKK